MRSIGMTLEQAEAIVAAAKRHGADSFLATQEEGSMLIEASLLAEEDGILEVLVIDAHGSIVSTGEQLEG
jgi:phage terminase large subunit-like protein